MSIKNHDGLRATETSPFAAGLAMRAVLEAEFHKRFRELLAQAEERAKTDEALTWDKLFFVPGKLGKEVVKPGPRLAHTLHRVVTALHQEREFTFSEANIGYDVCLVENATGGNPLVLVFGEQARGYRELLVEAGAAEAYGYWDNADPEETVTEEAWRERGQAWANLSDAAPSEVGLAFTFPSSLATAIELSKTHN